MILVGIDVAKDKHDCCITNTDGEMLSTSLPSPTTVRALISCTRESALLHQIYPK